MNPKTNTECGTSAGFSLAELLIVVASAAILITAAVPCVSHLQKAWILWNSARSVELSLQWARMHAIAANTPVIFSVEEDHSKFYWTDPESGQAYEGTVRVLPGKIRFSEFPARPLRFYPHGNAVPAGTYTLVGETDSYSIIVSPGGRIRFRKN